MNRPDYGIAREPLHEMRDRRRGTDAGIVTEKFWTMGLEGIARLDAGQLARVISHPQFTLREVAVWPPESITRCLFATAERNAPIMPQPALLRALPMIAKHPPVTRSIPRQQTANR